MSDDSNVFGTTEWERDLGPVRGSRVGAAAGGRELGCSLYEVDPGGQAAPYHMHHANEELLVVLEGVLELRTPDGARAVGKGTIVVFPAGPAGAHRLRNVSDAPARYLVVSTMRFPEVAEQLDTGTVLVLTSAADGWAFPPTAPGTTSGSRSRRSRPTPARGTRADGQPPPTPASTRPVPRQASQRLPSTSPSPPHSRHRSSPLASLSGGASSPGFMRSGSASLMPAGYPRDGRRNRRRLT
jgi:uncharacterized cupin superfamily protein